MATRQSQKRLTKEYKLLTANPPPYISAKPNDENILEWHYVITGPPNTPYEDGQYHGILRFPHEYPFKPPAISMITPNGRFKPNTRLCLSMSDYHPDTWNPAWSVATILTGLLSFMTGEEPTTGSISTSRSMKENYARNSKKWNNDENSRFVKQFPDVYSQNKIDIMNALNEAAKPKTSAPTNAKIIDLEHDEKPIDLNKDELDPEDRVRIASTSAGETSQRGWVNRSVVFVGVLLVAVLAAYFRSVV